MRIMSDTSHLVIERIRGWEIKLQTKAGVFAKQGVDVGSRLLIKQLEISDGSQIADLGCGSGVIGLVVAKLNPRGHVHLLDDHLRAVELAKENIRLNKLTNAEVYLSDLFSTVSDRTYHLILSNPPQHLGNEFLEEATKECLKHLKQSGQVIWVVQKHVKPVIERLFNQYFANCSLIARGPQHVVIEARKIK